MQEIQGHISNDVSEGSRKGSQALHQCRTIWLGASFLFLPLLQGKLTHLISLQYFYPLSYLVIYLMKSCKITDDRFFFFCHKWRCLQWLYKAGTSQAEPCQYPSLLAFNTVVIPVMSLSLKLWLPTLFKCVVVSCSGQRATKTGAGSTKLISWLNADSFTHNPS